MKFSDLSYSLSTVYYLKQAEIGKCLNDSHVYRANKIRKAIIRQKRPIASDKAKPIIA